MALTEAEETKLRTIIAAFEGGQQVDDLPLATDTVQDKKIEVFDDVTGASGSMDLRQAVRMSNAPSCGRVWDLDNSTPKAQGWFGSLELLRNLPETLVLGCYLVKNDHSRRKLDPTNHYRFASGETAKLGGSMGHYNWGWGKQFYLAIYRIGNLLYKEVSLAPIPGQYNYVIPVASMSAHGFAALDRTTGALVSYVNDGANYRGGENNATYDDTYRTLIGRAASNQTTEYWRNAARKNGSGWLCCTMRHTSVVKILFEIIFGTQDMQAGYNANKDADGLFQGGLGSGVTNMPGWGGYNGYRPFLPTSVGVELGDASGVSTYNVLKEDGTTYHAAPVPVFFGLKNPFGYLWRQMDDEFVRCNADTSATHLVAPSIYGNWTIGNEAGMTAYSTSPTRCESYIKTLSYDNLENFATQIGGSASTYHCGYLWNTSGATSGFRQCLRGCNACNGVQSGVSALNVYDTVSGANADWGSPLCEAESDWPVVPVYAPVA